MKAFIILCLLSTVSLSHAAQRFIGVFAGHTDQEICCTNYDVNEEDDLSAGAIIGLASEGALYVGAEVFIYDYNPGVAMRAGIRSKLGDFSVGAGGYNPGDEIYFAEYATTNGWFIRYTRMDEDVLASSVTQPGSIIVIDGPVSVTNDWYWLGYRFDF